MIGDNIFQTTANLQNEAAKLYGGIMQGGAGTAYQNVIDRGVADIEKQRLMAINALEANAPSSAFGGNRLEIAKRLANESYEDRMADFAAAQRLNQYNQQMNAAGRATGLGSQMFGQGQVALGQQQSAASYAQQEQQNLLNAARAQVLEQLGYPEDALATAVGLFGQLPRTNVNQGETPGLFDILSGVGTYMSGGGFGGFLS